MSKLAYIVVPNLSAVGKKRKKRCHKHNQDKTNEVEYDEKQQKLNRQTGKKGLKLFFWKTRTHFYSTEERGVGWGTSKNVFEKKLSGFF
jgi:hypothetical protein